jgi:flagellar biogenesis protein FliO
MANRSTRQPNRTPRTLAVLAALVVCMSAGAAMAQSAPAPQIQTQVQAQLAEPAAAQTQSAEGAKKPAYMQEDQPLQLKDYEEPRPAAPEPWYQQLFGFLFKLAMVIGLVILSLNVIKKVQSGKVQLPSAKGRNLVVLESVHLGPSQAVHVLSLGGDRLLVVGAGPQGLTTLSEISDPATVRALSGGAKANPSAFNQVFDLETVVQEAGSELFNETLRETRDSDFGRPRREWPRA